MQQLHTVQNYIESIYTDLHRIGALGPTPDSGFLRAGYSSEEREAIDLIARYAGEMGLQCSCRVGSHEGFARQARGVQARSKVEDMAPGREFNLQRRVLWKSYSLWGG